MSEVTNFEEYLKKNGMLTYSNVGTSMMPLLRQHRDLFTIRYKQGKRFEKGDVVLYKRPPDKYVLHRIIEVRPDDYVILGDNCYAKEYGITDEMILGRMVAYVRNGRDHTVNDRSFRLYSWFILHTIPVRVFFKRIKRRLKKMVKRLVYGKK